MARPDLRVSKRIRRPRNAGVCRDFSPGSGASSPPRGKAGSDATRRARRKLECRPPRCRCFRDRDRRSLRSSVLSAGVPSRLRIGLVVGTACASSRLAAGRRRPRSLPRPFRSSSTSRPGGTASARRDGINTLTSLGLALLAGAGSGSVVRGLRAPVTACRSAARALGVAVILLEGSGRSRTPACRSPPGRVRAEPAPQLHLPAGFKAPALQLLVDGRLPGS